MDWVRPIVTVSTVDEITSVPMCYEALVKILLSLNIRCWSSELSVFWRLRRQYYTKIPLDTFRYFTHGNLNGFVFLVIFIIIII